MPRRREAAQCPLTGYSINNRYCRCTVCRKHRASQQKRYRKSHPGYVKGNNLRQFGMTLSEWKAMELAQNGNCAVCFKAEVGQNQHGRMSLAVDHDHATGKVRALLCHRCNRALGLLGDDAKRVQALADYRRRF